MALGRADHGEGKLSDKLKFWNKAEINRYKVEINRDTIYLRNNAELKCKVQNSNLLGILHFSQNTELLFNFYYGINVSITM